MAFRKAKRVTLRSLARSIPAMMVLVMVISVGSLLTLGSAGTGNGAPSGAHYNLNLIGVEKGGSASSTSNGHVIFVPLTGNCKINLQENLQGNYVVVDPNCLDGSSLFQLPNPAPTSFTTGSLFTYSVWIRALTPKGSAEMTTCFTDTTGTFCNTGVELIVSLSKVTPPKFTDVSKQLLQACINGQLSPLFSNKNVNYFWYYQDTGLRLAQLRFYPVVPTTDTIGGSCSSTTLVT